MSSRPFPALSKLYINDTFGSKMSVLWRRTGKNNEEEEKVKKYKYKVK